MLPDGECVSVDGTHLGHNLPDRSGNRYCINLVSVPPHAPRTRPLAVPPLGSAPLFGSNPPWHCPRLRERDARPLRKRGPSQRIDPPGGEAAPVTPAGAVAGEPSTRRTTASAFYSAQRRYC